MATAAAIIPTCRACGNVTVAEHNRWKCIGCGAYADQFQTAADAARSERTTGRRAMRGQIAIALVLLVAGLGITLATAPWSSNSAGTWVIAFGPIIVGGGHLFRILVHHP